MEASFDKLLFYVKETGILLSQNEFCSRCGDALLHPGDLLLWGSGVDFIQCFGPSPSRGRMPLAFECS